MAYAPLMVVIILLRTHLVHQEGFNS